MYLFNVVNRISFSSILQIWYVEVRISRSISESPLEFEITRVDCKYGDTHESQQLWNTDPEGTGKWLNDIQRHHNGDPLSKTAWTNETYLQKIRIETVHRAAIGEGDFGLQNIIDVSEKVNITDLLASQTPRRRAHKILQTVHKPYTKEMESS